MSRILLASLAASSALLATGCPLAPGCGAYDGNGDRVYTHGGSDMLLICTNGGYSATIGTATHEGLASTTSFSEGATGAVASKVTNDNGILTAFGADDWQLTNLDETALDHADALCSDLATRTWWKHSALEAPVAFLGPDGAGKLTLCPDGTSTLVDAAGSTTPGSYAQVDGTLWISQLGGQMAQDEISQLDVEGTLWVIDENEVPACK